MSFLVIRRRNLTDSRTDSQDDKQKLMITLFGGAIVLIGKYLFRNGNHSGS
jgi:hypothetical protein